MTDEPASEDEFAFDQNTDGQDDGEFPMGDDSQFDDSQFDNDFDAGVEASEEEDPKKYIQQLAGKLSQSLRSYNENQPQPDVDLNKYVAGMINKQATENLTPKDVDEILSKIKSDGNTDREDAPDDDDNAPDNNDNGETPDFGNGDEENGDFEEPMPESIIREQKLNELFQEIINGKDDVDTKPIRNVGFRKMPFMSPNFK